MSKWINSTKTGTYNSWRAMRNRCLYRATKHYKEKGIVICERWESYDNFVNDMGERPNGTTLDRINNDENYCPENCRWSTWREQENNKQNLTRIEHQGESLTIGEWCHRLNLNNKQRNTVYKRSCAYGATSFEELFTKDRLINHRLSKRQNQCETCLTETTCKWRKNGTQCNTCWHREYRSTHSL